MNIKPLHDHIIVERVEEEVRKGGIIIPDTAKEKPQQGKVVAVGDGRRDEKGNKIPLEVKKDDIILFGKYAGTEIKLAEKDYLIIREEDVLGIVKKD
jgi:chaperonin GroES